MKPLIAIPFITLLLYRAYSRRSLTPLGLLVAGLTASLHALHPFALPFTLLGVFFLAGTAVTKVKHNVKASLTQSASGSGGEGPRNHVQVLANSGVATILTLLHAWVLRKGEGREAEEVCWHRPHGTRYAADVLLVGVVANYAAVAADTFSSELGILAKGNPRLITAPWKVVAKGTNGGVTLTGLLAGLGGSSVIAAVSWLLLPFCKADGGRLGTTKRAIPGFGHLEEYAWDASSKLWFTVAIALVGLGGSVLDSVLGAVLQASVVDVRSGKVVEGSGGRKVLVHMSNWAHSATKSTGLFSNGQATQRKSSKETSEATERHESRRIETGWDLLDNNGVNLLMAASMSSFAMLGACVAWSVPPSVVVGAILT